MESDKEILNETDVETNNIEAINEDAVGENDAFEISEEAKEQSRKFFKFGSKPKRESRKFESFEIVKTFTPKEKQKNDNEFDKILEVSNNQTTSEEVISVSSKTRQQQVKLKIRPQGKLIFTLISVIIILLSSLCIYNAVSINNLNQNIDALNNQITVQDLNIDKAIKNLNTLKNEAVSDEMAQELGLEQAEDYKEITLYERKPIKSAVSSSNWFDKLCNFISKMFGG